MNRTTKIWLVTAASLLVFGFVILGLSACAIGGDFSNMSTKKYETNTYDVDEKFDSISVDVDTSKIVFLPSDDGKTKVVCYEEKNMRHSVSVREGSLVINSVDTRKWYEHIGVNFDSPKVTVYLPSNEYSSLTVKGDTGYVDIPDNFTFNNINIKVSTGNVKCRANVSEEIRVVASTGDVSLEDISVGSLSLSLSTGRASASNINCNGDIIIETSTGNIKLSDTACKSVSLVSNTGKIELMNVVASEKLDIEIDTGDVVFEKCDAGEVYIESDTGDVKGSFLTDKIIFAETDTGRVDVPKCSSGGRCEISTDTGNIKITIVE